MIHKHYISAQQLLEDAFRLGLAILASGFRPSYMVGIWRGGAPVGIAVQELLAIQGVDCDHFPIRTASYTGIGERGREVRVFGLGDLVGRVEAGDRLLIVDDVYDTGLSIQAVLEEIARRTGVRMPGCIRIATPWYKPASNCTPRIPDYYVHETADWLVFPHELAGLTGDELFAHRPWLRDLFDEFGLPGNSA
jgi:hypothetical protein